MQLVTISNQELLLTDLNPEQQSAVTSPSSPTVVFAGPGSGKTTVLTRRVLYLLEQGIHPQNLMVVTFTRAAAKEMKERILQIAPQHGRRLSIGTFHSIFLNMLREMGEQIPRLVPSFEQVQWCKKWLQEKDHPMDDETISTFLNQIGLCKGNLIYPEQLQVKKPQYILFRDLYQAYEQWKQEMSMWDYDDILLAMEQVTRHSKWLSFWQDRYQHILVDEFQDINKVQYEIIKRLSFEHRHLFVVGDDDQAIYSFRGSDPSFMLRLRDDFPLRQIILQTNYRSTDEIIQLSEQLITQNRLRQQKKRVGTSIRGLQPLWIQPIDEEEEAEEIVTSLQDGVETAVLYRTGTQARAIIDALVRRQIPFTSAVSDSFYKRWQVQDLLAYFRLAIQPNDLDSLMRILNKPKRYLFGEEWMDTCWAIARKTNRSLLDSLADLPELKHYQKKHLQDLQTMVLRLQKMTASEGISYILEKIGYKRYLDAYIKETEQDQALIWEPIDEIGLAAKYFDSGQALLNHVDQVVKQMRESPPDAKVHLMTFHRVKGLQFERVFLIGLHAMVLPHRRSLQVAEHRKAAAWEEERRLLYVGMTRAKRELIFSVSQNRQGKRVAPSPFLKEINEKFIIPSTALSDQKKADLARSSVIQKKVVSRTSRIQRNQPQLQFAHESISPGTVITHRKFGEGRIIEVAQIEGVAPGRKLVVRFAEGVQTIHYELARQLQLIEVHPE